MTGLYVEGYAHLAQNGRDFDGIAMRVLGVVGEECFKILKLGQFTWVSWWRSWAVVARLSFCLLLASRAALGAPRAAAASAFNECARIMGFANGRAHLRASICTYI